MSRLRWVVVIAVAAAALGGALLWLALQEDGLERVLSPGSSTDTPEGLAEAATATAERGPVRLRVTLEVEMPPGFDDGVPTREIQGEGVADFEAEVASVDYEMSDVPNSAGFFGHVDGDMSVVYESDRFMITFPVLADVLEGEYEWLSYKLPDFSDPVVASNGIGQLREIGLSDPRLGLALVSSQAGVEPDADETVSIGLAEAESVVGEHLRPALEELETLGVDEISIETERDDEGLVSAYSYTLAYAPAGKGGLEGELSVTIDLVEAGVEATVEVPPEQAVRPYSELLAD